jgi:hypothetical protein
MDDWIELRTIALVLVWVTVGGGLLMAGLWLSAGGPRALGPEDELGAKAGLPVRSDRRITSFTTVQIGLHATAAVLTAILLTYAMTYEDGERRDAYLALIAALVVTAVPGVMMVRKWRSGLRPDVPVAETGAPAERVEDRIPMVVVLAHGLAAAATLGLVVALLLLD